MAQQGEAGASVHLSFDHLGLGVDSLGASVVVRKGERGGGGLDVQVQAAGEGVHVGQVRIPRGGDPLAEPGVVARVGSQQAGEGAGQSGQGGHLRAGAFEAGERLLLAGGEAVWPGEQDPGGPAG